MSQRYILKFNYCFWGEEELAYFTLNFRLDKRKKRGPNNEIKTKQTMDKNEGKNREVKTKK